MPEWLRALRVNSADVAKARGRSREGGGRWGAPVAPQQSLRQANGDPLGIEPGLTRKLSEILATEADKAAAAGRPLVLVTTPLLRFPLSSTFRGSIPDLTVLAFSELPPTKTVEVVAVLGK